MWSVIQSRMREWVPAAIALCLLLAARASLADHYVVPTGSMEPTLVPGDRVIADKTAYGLRIPFTDVEVTHGGRPARGEVVLFDGPEDGVRLIKRVVAVGGDVLAVRDGRVEVNGVPVGDATAEWFGARVARLQVGTGGPDVPPTRVPDGHVFVLGDARGNSKDSRAFGYVPEAAIYARAKAIFHRRAEGFVWRRL